ncbi:uncharacterized protein LOC105181924 [Harpegnathos saltator]|uniref:uncharacterized protein LOC105181924 n=1 Tax=Harpegnathos saltator TaxID=610380 RepID=UPI000DBEECC7|nr:uncharacterized protein LOC105181924 [Harpegnathos saltator]
MPRKSTTRQRWEMSSSRIISFPKVRNSRKYLRNWLFKNKWKKMTSKTGQISVMSNNGTITILLDFNLLCLCGRHCSLFKPSDSQLCITIFGELERNISIQSVAGELCCCILS